MIRHLIPHATWSGWSGDALTYDPQGGIELPNGFARSMRIAFGLPTTTPEHDPVRGGTICLQWLGLIVKIAIGRVT